MQLCLRKLRSNSCDAPASLKPVVAGRAFPYPVAMLTHPYDLTAPGQWLRGNLHAHTTRSDGKNQPQEVLDAYAALGHGFLMISDHDVHTGPEDYAGWDCHDMIMLPGNEVTASGPHMLHVDSDRKVPPHFNRQLVMDQVAQTQGFVVLNHPNWQETFDHCSMAYMNLWNGYIGLEIYNGVIGRLDGSPYATNKWDMLLTSGRRVWGFVNDDSHDASQDIGLGWNVAYVTDATPAGVVEALRAGRFYGSTGVEITKIQVDGGRIRIETSNAQRIVALRDVGKRFAVADGNAIEVEVPDSAKYVRFECWGEGERFAWTQPFWRGERALGQRHKFISENSLSA